MCVFVLNYFDFDGLEIVVEIQVGDFVFVCNVGVVVCWGKYICILDGDDLILIGYFFRYLKEVG